MTDEIQKNNSSGCDRMFNIFTATTVFHIIYIFSLLLSSWDRLMTKLKTFKRIILHLALKPE
jgi:hypothetical protein